MQNTIFNQIQIQTKTGCNLKCPMCPNSYMTQPEKTMSLEVFDKIIDELAYIGYTDRVSLYLMNEPFFDDRLPILVSSTRNKLPKSRINISTNGVLPSRDEITNLYDLGLSDCDISCYSKAIMDKFKGHDKRDDIHNMIDYKYEYNNRGGNIDVKKEPAYMRCERPFIQMYINAFGQAVLCCSDYKFEVIMGDINKNTLVEIWNGKMYQKYRDTLNKGTRKGLKLCSICNYP